MASHEETLRSRIALGWALELLVVAFVMIHMTIDSILADNDFLMLGVDPGPKGLKGLVYLVAIMALTPILVHWIHGVSLRALRWVPVAIAFLAFLFFVLHHLTHWHYGQRSSVSSNVLDVTIHLIGLWVIVNSIRWARFKAPAASP